MKRTDYPAVGETIFAETLPNGLRIRVIRKPDFSRTYAFFATDFGSIDMAFNQDGAKRVTPAGVAHYLEHKMFDTPDGSAMDKFAATGASPNAFTSYDMTGYYFECTDRFEENLRILLNFVSNPYFTDESVEKERGIIGQEIKMYEDNPGSRVYENLFRAMYAFHPIRVPIAGTVESIADITAQTLSDCHRAFYAPANMVLCVAGDVDPERVDAVVREVLPAESSPVSGRDYGPDESMETATHRVSRKMEVAMPMFVLGCKCRPAADGPAQLRLDILGDLAADVLCGESSPLYQRLYEENLIDAGFSAGYESIKGACLLEAAGDSRDPDAVAAAITEEARRIVREGVDEALLAQLKKSAVGRRIRELDSLESVCYRQSTCTFSGADYNTFPALYESITAAEVAAFLDETVVPSRTVLSVINPKDEEESNV